MKIARQEAKLHLSDVKPGQHCEHGNNALLRVYHPDLRDPSGEGRLPFAREDGAIGWYPPTDTCRIVVGQKILSDLDQGASFSWKDCLFIKGPHAVGNEKVHCTSLVTGISELMEKSALVTPLDAWIVVNYMISP